MKSKNDDLQNTVDKFTKWKDNMNLLIGNQREPYNKSSIGYENKDNIKNFSNLCHAHQIPKCNPLSIIYYNILEKQKHTFSCLRFYSFCATSSYNPMWHIQKLIFIILKAKYNILLYCRSQVWILPKLKKSHFKENGVTTQLLL